MTWFLQVKKILVVILDFYNNWLSLIHVTLCENITLLWSCGPDCVVKYCLFTHTDTWGQLVLLTTTLNHKTCINTSRQALEKTLFAIIAIFTK